MRKLGIPPENLQPGRYVGPKASLTPCVEAKRRPSTLDRTHPLLTMWRVDASPTSGEEGEIWQLVRFESGSGDATWRRIDFSSSGPGIDSLTVDQITAPGVNPVEADGTGNITISGSVVTNHSIPLEAHSRALNSYNLEVQTAVDRTGAPASPLDAGICSFDDSAFIVDANGYVTLVGGLGPAVDGIDVDFNTAPGTDPVVPNGAGVISLYGNVVVNGTNANSPVATHSRAANQSHIDVQLSTAITVPADPNDVGLASFDSAVFSVDANGWVSLAGGGLAVDSFQVDAVAGTGVNPVVATVAGLVTISGGVVVNADIPLQSISRAPNEYNLEVQVAKAVTGAPGVKTGAGVATFDDNHFTVNSDGYVTAIGAAAGGIKWLATATAPGGAGVASLEFTSLIDSNYNVYLFVLKDLVPITDGDGMFIRTSSDTGISYDVTAGDYYYSNNRNGASSSSINGTAIIPGSLAGTDTDESNFGFAKMSNPSDTGCHTYLSGDIGGKYNATYYGSVFCGVRAEDNLVDAVQFLYQSGNVFTGEIKMYGMTTPS